MRQGHSTGRGSDGKCALRRCLRWPKRQSGFAFAAGDPHHQGLKDAVLQWGEPSPRLRGKERFERASTVGWGCFKELEKNPGFLCMVLPILRLRHVRVYRSALTEHPPTTACRIVHSKSEFLISKMILFQVVWQQRLSERQ